jgi:uncharacterized lipoprotein
MRRTMTAIAVAGLLSACSASPGTMQDLQAARSDCGTGNLAACNSIPYVQQAASQEARNNTAALLALFLLPVLIFAR